MKVFNTALAKNFMHNMDKTNKRLGILGMQIATGNRLVNAGIDPAGMAISEGMRAQIRGLDMATRNLQMGIDMMTTAEGAMGTAHSITQRMKELAVQAANGTYTDEDIAKIQMEFEELKKELDSIGGRTQYNGKNLLDGKNDPDTGDAVVIQSGANPGQTFSFYLGKISSEALGLDDIDFTTMTQEEISASIEKIDKATKIISNKRASIGASINRAESAVELNEVMSENLSAAASRICDTDMAKAMSEYVRHQILLQASTAMLANLYKSERDSISYLLQSM